VTALCETLSTTLLGIAAFGTVAMALIMAWQLITTRGETKATMQGVREIPRTLLEGQ
jgi:hypothetical protein